MRPAAGPLLVLIGLLLGLLLTACAAHRPASLGSQRSYSAATQADRPAYQRLRRPLYPSAATPRLTPLGDFDTPRAYLGEQWRHRGLDIAALAGEPVIAAAPGTACAGHDEIHGRTVTLFPKLSPEPGAESDLVLVTHSQGYGATRERRHLLRILYAHLRATAPDLAPCRFVALGEVIGTVGATGIASSPHLHFEVTVRDPAALDADPSLRGAINPLYLMRREQGERLGTITCHQEGMSYRPNAGEDPNTLTIIWPMLGC